MHSGRQFGGFPMYSCKQVQIALSFTALHVLYGPQGDGLHGSLGGSAMKMICERMLSI